MIFAAAAAFAVISALWALPRSVQQILATVLGIVIMAALPVFGIAAFAIAIDVLDRRKYQFSLRWLFVFVTVVAVALALVPNVRPLDWLLGFACDENAIYSDGYSAWRWSQVRRGMQKEAVLELLGPPLKAYDDREETWHYTSYGPSETYHRRELVFKGGAVVEKRAELYVD
ncbi:MAG TPA: hypothetical protein VFI31_01900 [Pirellulales bacterium]|nr:hypothetical protein [Pirellulales bacterium]